jgi:hypothetical protein
MLNFYTSESHPVREELKLRCWQFVLRLTRLAAGAQEWAHLFNQNRKLMALAFLTGVLIGLIPLIK